jgi:hypothetical protein
MLLFILYYSYKNTMQSFNRHKNYKFYIKNARLYKWIHLQKNQHK